MDQAGSEADVGGLVARLFCNQLLAVAARSGLVRGYRRLPVRTATLRGRIDFAQLCRGGGRLDQMPCIVWERLADTTLNRFLAAATQAVRRDPVLATSGGQAARNCEALLDGIPTRVDPRLLRGDEPLTRLEAPFEGVCSLARLILRQAGLGEGSDRQGVGFTLNLEDLFEKAVVRAFQESGVDCQSSQPLPYQRLSPSGQVTSGDNFEMDLYCPELNLVVDAKYKTKVASSNLQQMLSYCWLTGARRAILVFPGGHLTDRRPYHFLPHGDTGPVRVDLAELRTDASNLEQWRLNARELVDACRTLGALA